MENQTLADYNEDYYISDTCEEGLHSDCESCDCSCHSKNELDPKLIKKDIRTRKFNLVKKKNTPYYNPHRPKEKD